MLSFAASLFLAGSLVGYYGRVPALAVVSTLVLAFSLAVPLSTGAGLLGAIGTAFLGLAMLQGGFVAALVHQTAGRKIEEARVPASRRGRGDGRRG